MITIQILVIIDNTSNILYMHTEVKCCEVMIVFKPLLSSAGQSMKSSVVCAVKQSRSQESCLLFNISSFSTVYEEVQSHTPVWGEKHNIWQQTEYSTDKLLNRRRNTKTDTKQRKLVTYSWCLCEFVLHNVCNRLKTPSPSAS